MSSKKKEDRIKSAQSNASYIKKSKEATSGGISSDSKSTRINIWPEWIESEINNEKWDVATKAKEKDKTKSPQMSQNLFDDPDGRLRLPPSLKAVKWKRAYEHFTKNPVVVDNEEGIHKFDLFTSNEHLLVCETMRWIICQIDLLWTTSEKKHMGEGDLQIQENHFVSSDGTYHTWKFWDHIYALNKVGKGLPQYNPAGKYIVKLFWMGEWRKILIDDTLPFDENDQLLLPVTTLKNELWSIILSKALLKIASLNYGFSSNETEFGDFSVIHSLTGWIPQKKIVSKEHKNQVWCDFQKLLCHWTYPDGNVNMILTEKNEAVPNSDNMHLDITTEKAEVKEPVSKDKGKKDVKDNKQKDKKEKNKVEKIPEPKLASENPETLILASYTSTYHKMNMLSASKMADHSEALRKIGISQLYSHPILINCYRDCPLTKPKTPEIVPSWKLIRPLVKPDIPKANDCIIHNVSNHSHIYNDRNDEIKFLEIQSPFLNYKITNTTVSQNTIENIIEDFEDNFDMQTKNDISNMKFPKDSIEIVKDSETSKSISTNNRNTTLSKATKGQVTNENTAEEEIIKVSATDKPNNKNNFHNEMNKFWIDIDTFFDCFQYVYVYHKTETYRYSESYADMKLSTLLSLTNNSRLREPKRSVTNIPSSSEKRFKDNLSPKGVREIRVRKVSNVLDNSFLIGSDYDFSKTNSTDQKEPMYLFVDNIDVTEVIFCLSTFCKWFTMNENLYLSEFQGNRTSPSTSAIKESSTNFETVESDHENSGSDALRGMFIAENHSWKSFQVGKCLKRVRTNGTKAISLKFPPGRNCLRIFIQSSNGFHCKLISQNQFYFGNEDKILPLFTEQPKRILHLSLNMISLYNKIIASFSNVEERKANENQLINLILGFNKMENSKVSTSTFTQIFSQSLLSALNEINKDIFKPDMMFALKALNLDFQNPNVTSNAVVKQNSNRNSAKVVPSKTDNRKQSSTKLLSSIDVKEEKKVEIIKEYSPSDLIQILRLQKFIRGFHVRKVLKARDPQSSCHNRVVSELQKLSTLIDQNSNEIGLVIMNNIMDNYPPILNYYHFETDKLNHICLKEYVGHSNLQSGTNFDLLFRDVFYVDPSNKSSGKYLIKLSCSNQKCNLTVINNDNGKIYSENILKRLSLLDLKSNNNGYTLMASVKDAEMPVDWKLKVIGDGNDILPKFSKPELCCDFSISKLRDYFVPNENDILFQEMVKVKNDHNVTVFVKLSNPHIQIRLSIFNFEEEIYYSEGVGEALIQSFTFLKDRFVDEHPEVSGRSHSRTSNKSKRNKDKTDRFSAKTSRTNSSCSSEENKVNKYSIRVFVNSPKWSLSPSEIEFVEKIKQTKRKDINENKFLSESPIKSVSNSELPKKEGGQKAQLKPKGKDKAQESSKALKTHDKQGTKNLSNDINFDSEKPHYVACIFSDASAEDNINLFKNNEKYDNLRSMKKIWLEMDPVRFEKGKQTQMRFIEENQILVDPSSTDDKNLNKMSSKILDLSEYYPDQNISEVQESRVKKIELFREYLSEWSLWCQTEKANRTKRITDTLNICYNRQKVVDSHRLNYYKAREKVRQNTQMLKKEIELK